ncbi:unnamed protein product [Schistosoma margrebowiei]|uniref:Uncharacterized protein n=1 Tax=Schistosoma margrebowiei TaxID=48269 RepID=A0A183MEP4_9TREM|nr:unnamed protein product [Schistosoma margrebowiei]
MIVFISDEIKNFDPNGMKNIDKSQVYLTSPELIACFQKSAKDYEKMKTDHSEAICNRLIPYKTKGIREIDQIIRWKYYDVEELNIKF